MNTLQLYGNIGDVFEGKITPSILTQENAGVSEALSFGLGVSCFADDRANIGDAVYFNQRFLIRSTQAGEERDPHRRKFKEGRAQDYRTVYSLGVTKHPLAMTDRKFLSDARCPAGFTVEDLISRVIGPARTPTSTPRTFGFLGLLDYENIYATSLVVPPIHGENIIPLMEKYARPSHPLPKRSGLVMGFVRDRVSAQDDGATKALAKRLFFDNPKDHAETSESERASQEFLCGPHWISHTHGVCLPAGQSVLPSESEALARMSSEESFCASVIERTLNQTDFADCGHVIPRSTLRRYFLIAFPIHAIEAFH